MTNHAWMLAPLLLFAPTGAAMAADAGQQQPPTGQSESPAEKQDAAADTQQAIDACKQQRRETGERSETKSALVCAVKSAFQSRIRRKPDEEPVEMTLGSPPMVTDDTDTPGDKNWEVNLVFHSESGGGEHRIEAPTFDINYGVGDKLQLKYELPYVFQRTREPDAFGVERSEDANGFGDSNFGVKYRFYDDEDTGLSFALYPQVEFHTPGANRDVSEGGTAFILPILMTKEFEHSSISANLGAEFAGGEQRTFASFGIGWRLSDRTAMLAEIAGTDLNASDEKRVLLNLGFRHKVGEKRSFSGSIGRDVFAGGDEAKQTYVMLAWQMTFGE